MNAMHVKRLGASLSIGDRRSPGHKQLSSRRKANQLYDGACVSNRMDRIGARAFLLDLRSPEIVAEKRNNAKTFSRQETGSIGWRYNDYEKT